MSGPWIAAFVALAVLVLGMGVLLAGTLRQATEALTRLAGDVAGGAPAQGHRALDHDYGGLEPGREMPGFEATDAAGETVSSLQLRGRPFVILFSSPDCASCQALIQQVRDLPGKLGVSLYVVSDDSEEGRAVDVGSAAVALYQRDRSVSRAFHSAVMPHAFAVDADGVVAGRGAPSGAHDLARLASMARRGARSSP